MSFQHNIIEEGAGITGHLESVTNKHWSRASELIEPERGADSHRHPNRLGRAGLSSTNCKNLRGLVETLEHRVGDGLRRLSTGCFGTTFELPHSLHWKKMCFSKVSGREQH